MRRIKSRACKWIKIGLLLLTMIKPNLDPFVSCTFDPMCQQPILIRSKLSNRKWIKINILNAFWAKFDFQNRTIYLARGVKSFYYLVPNDVLYLIYKTMWYESSFKWWKQFLWTRYMFEIEPVFNLIKPKSGLRN